MRIQSFSSLGSNLFSFVWRDFWITVLTFAAAVGVCIPMQIINSIDGFAAPVFVLAVLTISLLTNGYLFGLIASVLGVVCVNFIFTYPYWSLDFTLTGYPVTFFTLLAVSVTTCTLTTRLRQQERLHNESEREKIRANLLRSVSHDIRTPLTSIVGSTSAVLDNPGLSLPEQRELLEDVRNEAQWLIRVVENLLSITRMGDSQAHITKEPEAAEEVIGEAARKFRRRFPNILTTVTVPSNLLLVPMDPILIEQVLSNLLENAAIHGKTTSQIQLAIEEDNGFARFSVTDNGQGIPPKLLPSLFSGMIHHHDNASGDGKRNMGLGLSVCHAIVHAHGGTMDAKNLDLGAEFSFRLPLYKEETR